MPVIEGINIITQPPVNGFGRRALFSLPQGTEDNKTIASLTHPDYSKSIADWDEWRLIYNCDNDFIEQYLKKFSDRESQTDFNRRKEITPIPGFATAAINDIKNAIFQRAADITREGGPKSYLDSANGSMRGVDLQNSTMNWFIGTKIIPELLVMAKVGVFIDAPKVTGPTLADKGAKHPYIYSYRREDIRSWAFDDEGNLTSLLLRDWIDEVDKTTGLPMGRTHRFRLLVVNPIVQQVQVALFDKEGKYIPDSSTILTIPIIPFVIFEISSSLFSLVARHQVALLNAESSDLAWVLKAGYPIYTEQQDSTFNGNHFKKTSVPAEVAAVAECDLNDFNNDEEIRTGTGHGRRYGKDLERPGFIHPSSEPLKASMDKQRQLKEDIRTLVNLSLSNIRPIMASAESKGMDLQGLESGLSSCGIELEHGERQIAQIWALYENAQTQTTIKYPKNYSLKTNEDRLKEADENEKRLFTVPSKTYRQAILQKIAKLLIGNEVSDDTLKAIDSEISSSDLPTADPGMILEDVREGLLSKETASTVGRGYPKGEVEKAAKEHLKRVKAIAISQTLGAAKSLSESPSSKQSENPAARGLPDLSNDPTKEAAEEKSGKPKRGEAKS